MTVTEEKPRAEARTFSSVPLSWGEVYFTSGPVVSANSSDQEPGLCKMDLKKLGVDTRAQGAVS